MTRLDQALRWWRNHELGCGIFKVPRRHAHVLYAANAIRAVSHEGPLEWGLTDLGHKLLEERAKRQGDGGC